jgi:hypothetical protein
MRGGQWQVLALLERLGSGCTLLAPGDGPLLRAAHERGIDAQPLTLPAIAALSRRAELTHAHDARSHSWAATLARGPLIVSRRVAFPVAKSFLSRWKYSRPQHYIAVSHHVKETLLAADVPQDRISVVYDGVDPPPAPAAGDWIVAPRFSDPMKGGDLLARAAAIANVKVHYSENLRDDLNRACLFVYITRSEGLGSAALLAMGAGVPVVASRVGGLPEIVVDGVTGYLTANDPEAIAQCIRRALTESHHMREEARRHVAARFTTKVMASETRRIYEKVVAC